MDSWGGPVFGDGGRCPRRAGPDPYSSSSISSILWFGTAFDARPERINEDVVVPPLLRLSFQMDLSRVDFGLAIVSTDLP